MAAACAGYTCLSCHVVFANAELQRAHYKCDWHRYNLKRKVASLPAVSAEEFQRRVIAQREATEAAESPSAGTYCNACGKHFGTPKSYDNHVKSKKHQEAVAKAESSPPGVTTKQSKATSPSKDIIEALAGVVGGSSSRNSCSHMVALKNAKNAIEHGPRSSASARAPSLMALASRASGIHPEEDDEYEDDDDDLDEDSEWESIDGEGDDFEEGDEEEAMEEGERVPPTECLFCGEAAASVEANVAHMGAAHSFFLPDAEYLVDAEGLLVYLGYKLGVGHCCLWCGDKRAPFRSLHAVQQHMRDKGHCKLSHEGAEGLMEYSDFYDYTSSYPDEKEGGGGEGDEEVDLPPVLDGQGWQLVLPSGAVAGHRSLARYYRQNLPVMPSKSRDSAQRVLSQYRALGWTGSTTREEAQKKARDIRFMQNVRAKQQMQLGCRANKLQKHFRQQVLF